MKEWANLPAKPDFSLLMNVISSLGLKKQFGVIDSEFGVFLLNYSELQIRTSSTLDSVPVIHPF